MNTPVDQKRDGDSNHVERNRDDHPPPLEAEHDNDSEEQGNQGDWVCLRNEF